MTREEAKKSAGPIFQETTYAGTDGSEFIRWSLMNPDLKRREAYNAQIITSGKHLKGIEDVGFIGGDS